MFSKSSFGLDISDESLKFVELIPSKDGIQIGKHGEKKLPAGVIENGVIRDSKKLGAILSSLRKDYGIKSVRVSLLHGDWPNIRDHLLVFKDAKMSVKSFESRVQALTRSVVKPKDMETHMVINPGRKQSSVFIVSGGNVIHGSNIVSDSASSLREEAAKHFLDWHEHKDKKPSRLPVKKIILCGTEGNLLGFSEYLSVGLRNKVEVANVWINVIDTEKNIPEITFGQSFIFASALGLALRDFN